MRIKTIIKFTLLLALLAFLYAFSAQRNQARKLSALDVKFVADGNYYITTETVNKLLIQNQDSITDIAKHTIDLRGIERRLDSHPMIQKSEVYLTVDGILSARVRQRKPIARVVDKAGYYLDQYGVPMPLSEHYAARVPLLSGISDSDYADLTRLLKVVADDDFMNRHLTGVHKNENGDLLLLLRVYDFDILLGKPEKLAKKFQNFKAFYQKTQQDSSLYNYKTINLKLDSQVVAVRK